MKAYDVRSETREQAESLGAQFLKLTSVADASGSGGYARELTEEERTAQQAELNGHIGSMDVVITTAQVPGRRPPVLVTAEAVAQMKPGSVIVDMAASALGGNVELVQPDQTITTDNGVTIIAPTNLPATMPAGASGFFARNISALLAHFVADGAMALRLRRRDHGGHGHHARRQGRPRGDREAARASRSSAPAPPPGARRCSRSGRGCRGCRATDGRRPLRRPLRSGRGGRSGDSRRRRRTGP